MKQLKIIAAALFLLSPLAVNAVPLEVTYDVSGSSGNYLLDFTVTNNVQPNEGAVYFFGVSLSGENVINGPWSQWYNGNAWYNSSYGGCCVYNNNWLGSPRIGSGSSLGGFQVQIADAIAPTDVNWFAFLTHGYYNGNDYLNSRSNPGFEGIATISTSVPEPGTLALLGLGLAGMSLSRRKMKA